jgi:hypothetical protein
MELSVNYWQLAPVAPIRRRSRRYSARGPGPRSTAVLLEAGDAIEATAKKLPYVSGY